MNVWEHHEARRLIAERHREVCAYPTWRTLAALTIVLCFASVVLLASLPGDHRDAAGSIASLMTTGRF